MLEGEMKRFLLGDSFCKSAKSLRLNCVWAWIRAGSIALGRGVRRRVGVDLGVGATEDSIGDATGDSTGRAIGEALEEEGMAEQPTTPMVLRLMTTARVRQPKGCRCVMVDRRLPVL